jgi:hypothetical protein
MPDLAPFVAAALNDKVMYELLEEVEALKRRLATANRVSIKGPNGTIYAQGQLDDDGSTNLTREVRFHVNVNSKQSCPLDAIRTLEVSVGNLYKTVLRDGSKNHPEEDSDIETYWFATDLKNAYCPKTQRGVATFFLRHAGICLFSRIGPISEEAYFALAKHTAFRESDLSNVNSILKQWGCNQGIASDCAFEFVHVLFLNDSLYGWNFGNVLLVPEAIDAALGMKDDSNRPDKESAETEAASPLLTIQTR